MAKFIRVNSLMVRFDQMEERERLGLPEEAVDDLYNPICIDLDRVVTYMHHYNKEGEVVPGYSELTFTHGGLITIDVDFQQIDKLLRGVTK
jgi:hypothetical protein